MGSHGKGDDYDIAFMIKICEIGEIQMHKMRKMHEQRG
jgi:hypothetical protein